MGMRMFPFENIIFSAVTSLVEKFHIMGPKTFVRWVKGTLTTTNI